MPLASNPDRRRAAFPGDFLVRVGAAWAVVSALLVAVNWTAITAHRFPDPDDIMRLVQVRDLLAGQSWFDPTQYRVNAPAGGVAMHWSRLVDLPLVLVIWALAPLIGPGPAQNAALIGVPLFTLGCAMVLAARIAWRVMGREETLLTALMLALSVPILFQMGPLRIDHHGWQIVCALAVVNALMARRALVGGWVIGAVCAVWLAISIEGLVLAAAIFAVLALRWWRNRADWIWLVSAIQSLAIFSALLFVMTRGLGQLATYCDAISPVHLAMFGWGAAVLSVLARFAPMSRTALVTGFALAGGGALTMLLYAAPHCVSGGGFAALDPVVAQYWHANVLEGMPIWRQLPGNALQYVLPPAVGLVAAINLATRARDWQRSYWRDYALILGAAVLISVFVSRAGAVACALAAAPLAWQLRRWLNAIRSMPRPAMRMVAMLALVCVLLPALPAMIVANAWTGSAALGGAFVQPNSANPANAANAAPGPRAPAIAPVKPVDCRVQDNAPLLASLPRGEVFAPLDIAPELLLVSDHTVIATGHHRGDAGMKILIETALASAPAAKETLQGRGTAYVALCPDLGEARLYSGVAPDGFIAQLAKGNAPDWLAPITLDPDSKMQLWRIIAAPPR